MSWLRFRDSVSSWVLLGFGGVGCWVDMYGEKTIWIPCEASAPRPLSLCYSSVEHHLPILFKSSVCVPRLSGKFSDLKSNEIPWHDSSYPTPQKYRKIFERS